MLEQEHRLEWSGPDFASLDVADGKWAGAYGDKDSVTLVIQGRVVAKMPAADYPLVRLLRTGETLLIDALPVTDGPNAWLISADGLIQSSFRTESGVADAAVFESSIFVTYFQRDFFGSIGPNQNSATVFSIDGRILWGGPSGLVSESVDVSDCQCLVASDASRVAYVSYVTPRLVELDIVSGTLTSVALPAEVAGARALCTDGSRFWFQGAHGDDWGVFEWQRGAAVVRRIGQYAAPLRGTPGGSFITLGTRGYTTVDFKAGAQ